MRALIFDGQVARLVTDHPLPGRADGEVLVRPRRTLVTGLEVGQVRTLGPFRGVLGHAFVGTVEEAADTAMIGRRVVAASVIRCGRCDLCLAGLRAHCRGRQVIGLDGHDGALADAVITPATNLVQVPDAIDDDHAAFAAPLAAAMNAARHMTIDRRPFVTVLGDGLMGMLTVQVMRALNATVRMVGRHPEKLDLCEKWGVKHRHVQDIGLRADQDVVVDCTGRPDGLETATRLARPRATIVTLSHFSPRVSLDTIVRNELRVVGSFGFPMRPALDALQRREIEVASLISRRMKLADGVALLETAARPEVISVLADCG